MNQKLRAVLVDDESLMLNVLQKQLERHCPEVEILAQFSSPQEAAEGIPELKFDLLFLDIHMPGMNGFQLLEKIGMHAFRVVFITAYDTYAIQAFRVNALDYLLKPIDSVELKDAIAKLKQETQRVIGAMADETNAAVKPDGLRRFPIASADGVLIVDIEDILYLEAASNYTLFQFRNGKSFTASKNLAYFEQQLPGNSFFRSHNSFLIHLRYVDRYIRGEGGFVEMPDGRQLEVSRRRKPDLLRLLSIS